MCGENPDEIDAGRAPSSEQARVLVHAEAWASRARDVTTDGQIATAGYGSPGIVAQNIGGGGGNGGFALSGAANLDGSAVALSLGGAGGSGGSGTVSESAVE